MPWRGSRRGRRPGTGMAALRGNPGSSRGFSRAGSAAGASRGGRARAERRVRPRLRRDVPRAARRSRAFAGRRPRAPRRGRPAPPSSPGSSSARRRPPPRPARGGSGSPWRGARARGRGGAGARARGVEGDPRGRAFLGAAEVSTDASRRARARADVENHAKVNKLLSASSRPRLALLRDLPVLHAGVLAARRARPRVAVSRLAARGAPLAPRALARVAGPLRARVVAPGNLGAPPKRPPPERRRSRGAFARRHRARGGRARRETRPQVRLDARLRRRAT